MAKKISTETKIEEKLVFSKGVWREEQGVKYLTFEMPMREDKEIHFGFISPTGKDGTAIVSNTGDLLGIILLFKKHE
jgi:hypothetical protein